MKFVTAIFAIGLSQVVSAAPAAQQLSMIAPVAVAECQNAGFIWAGGVAPYSLIVQGTGSQHVIFANVHGITGTRYGWTANATAGTFVEGHLTDSAGAKANSSSFQVQSTGGSSSCIKK